MLTLDEATHTYRYAGAVVPSVTQVLAPLFNWDAVPPEVLERKRLIGDAVHKAIALDLADDLDEASIVEPWASYFEGWRKFKRDSGFVCLAYEEPVYHEQLRYAGTFDLFGLLKGKPAKIDTKSTHVLHPAVGPQTAAYDEARRRGSLYREKAARYALQLGSDGRPHLHPLTDPSDWNIFMSLLNVHHYKTRHKLP
jgi:hypothetical protein